MGDLDMVTHSLPSEVDFEVQVEVEVGGEVEVEAEAAAFLRGATEEALVVFAWNGIR